MPKPWLASLLSALVPGAGHIYAGDRLRGRRLILIDLALITVVVIAAFFFRAEILKAWLSLSALSLIMVGNIALLSFRAWAAYDAYYLVEPDRTPRAAGGVLVGLLVFAVVLIPHVSFGYINVTHYSFLADESVFAPPVTTPAPDPGVTLPPGETTTTVPAPTLWDGLERLNILLLGSDVGIGRTGLRTDTVILVSIDPATGNAAMVSLPRNMTAFPLPEGMGRDDTFPQLLNDLYWHAHENPDLYPGSGEPGTRALKAAVGHMLGVDVHYYALVSMDGFIGIVDALGGVEIDIPTRIVDEEYPHEDGVSIVNVVIEPGLQKLNGHLALAYARIRRHSDDFARMNRQRCVLGALVEQSNPLELLARYGAITGVLRENLVTDIPRDRLVDFIDILRKMGTDKIGAMHVDRAYETGPGESRGTVYDMERIHRDAQTLFADPSTGSDATLESACD